MFSIKTIIQKIRGLALIKPLFELSGRQWLYLPRLFSSRERFVAAGLAAVSLISFIALADRLYLRLTIPQPAVGGEFTEGVLDPPRFVNPIYATTDTDRSLSNLVFSKLVTHDAQGKIIMDAAENVDISPDGKGYTVKLKPNIKWHDGKPFSADDVLFTIKTIQDSEYKSPLRADWQGVTIEKLNDATVRFTLAQPYAPFMENLAVGIIPAHLWENISSDAAPLSDLNLKPIGSGPYLFKSFTRTSNGPITDYTLARNDRYYGDGPFLKQVDVQVLGDAAALKSAFQHGDISGFLAPADASTAALAKFGGQGYIFHLPQIFAVFLNGSTNPALGRHAVRQALAQAIDRERLMRETLQSDGVLVNSALPPGALGFRDDIPGVTYDPQSAKDLLAADGWKMDSARGLWTKTEGSGRKRTTTDLTVTLATADAPDLVGAASLIRDMWQTIGVKTDVQILQAKDLESSLIRPRAYQTLLFGEVFGHDPDPYPFWHTSQLKDPGLNIALYSNRQVDSILAEARRTPDTAKRADLYGQFQKIVADDIGAIFLYTPLRSYVAAQWIKGIALPSVLLPDERFNQLQTWYTEMKRVFR